MESTTNMANESWRGIRGFKYSVSNFGRIRRSIGGPGTRSGKVLKLKRCTNGYLNIGLCQYGKYTWILVHKIVAQAFLGPTPEGLEIDHIDGDKTNNRVDNLRFITHSENLINSFKLGTNSRAKLDRDKVIQIRELAEEGDKTYVEIAKIFGVTPAAIRAIVIRRTWKWIP